MEVGKYTLHRRAVIALHQLPDAEQMEVRERLATLVAIPPAEWSSSGVQKLASDPSLYLLRVNASLRVILRAGDGQRPEILDVVRHETLESFATTGA
jgi:hypothetical protein